MMFFQVKSLEIWKDAQHHNPKVYYFPKEWVSSPKLAQGPRFFKLNYHPLSWMTKIIKNTNNLKMTK